MSSSSSSSSSSGGTSSSTRSHTYEYAGRQVEILIRTWSAGEQSRQDVNVSVDGQPVKADLLGEKPEQAETGELESRVNKLIDDKTV